LKKSGKGLLVNLLHHQIQKIQMIHPYRKILMYRKIQLVLMIQMYQKIQLYPMIQKNQKYR
jgi:hypothetical protein